MFVFFSPDQPYRTPPTSIFFFFLISQTTVSHRQIPHRIERAPSGVFRVFRVRSDTACWYCGDFSAVFVSFLVIRFSAAGEGPRSTAWRGGVLAISPSEGIQGIPRATNNRIYLIVLSKPLKGLQKVRSSLAGSVAQQSLSNSFSISVLHVPGVWSSANYMTV